MVKSNEVMDIRDGTHDSPKYAEEGYPLITSKNLKDGRICFQNINYISDEDFININKRSKVDIGDILYSMIGSIGNYALVEDEANFAIKNVALFKFNNPNLYNKYFYYLLSSSGIINQIEYEQRGGTQKFITLKILRNLKFPLPPLKTQQKIAAILDEADRLRQLDKQLIQKYEDLSQSLFLEMFGDPVVNPKKWKKQPFNQMVHKECPLTYGIVQPGEEFENGVLCVRPVDLKKQYITNHNLKKIDPGISNNFKRTVLDGGELLLSVRGSVGEISIASESLKGANVTRGIVPIWFDKDISSKLFFYYLYKSESIQREVKRKAKGATLIQINLSDLRELELITPPIRLQNDFQNRIMELEKQKVQAQNTLKRSEELFQSLLQKAFKGELITD